MCRVVAYYRVSTDAQGRSGLGLEAQRQAVRQLCDARGWDVIDERTEVESGKTADRPQLAAALHHAKVTGATLVVAKLDRLSRSVAFLSALQDSGAKFVAADMPEANDPRPHHGSRGAGRAGGHQQAHQGCPQGCQSGWPQAGQPEWRRGSPQGWQGERSGCGEGEGGGRQLRPRPRPCDRRHSGERGDLAGWHRSGTQRPPHSDPQAWPVACLKREELAG